ncbi:MAG: LysR family transcriptional regulator [Salinarimonadaceae bacterium]|nr:MAG: LysR family transcriptional regulator [Salinarimonadaceae bacterium]
MQLRQIEVFHAVMITGSTVAAAEMLNVTQPAISTTLKRMQDELGLVLLSNAAGRLVPTPEAHELFAQAHAIQEDVESLRRLARLLATGKVGTLRLGVVPAVSEGILARAVMEIRGEAPDLALSVDVLNSHDLVNRLTGGRLDLACVFGAEHGVPLETLFSCRVPLVCVAPLGAFDDGRDVSPDDLAALPQAAMRATDPIGRLLAGWSAKKPAQPVVELRSSRGVLALARAGVAAGVVDTLTLNEAGPGSIVVAPLSPPLEVDFRILRVASGPRSTSIERACEALSRAVRSSLAGDAPA